MRPRAYAIIGAGFLTVSIAYAIRYGYGALLPQMLSALRISKTEAGMISASYFMAYTLCSPLLGLLTDRYDVRLILTFFSALLAAGALGMAMADSVTSATLYFTLAGVGHAACWVPVVALVQQWVPDQCRGTALSFTTLGTGVGIGGWTLLLPVIVTRHGWQGGWVCMGSFGLVVAALNYILVRKPPNAHAFSPAGRKLGGTSLLREPALWFIGLSYLCVGFTVLVPYTFLSVYATEVLDLPYATATRFLAVIAISGMGGKLVLGTLSDRLGRIPVMMACGALLGGGCLGMIMARETIAMHTVSGVFGIGWGAVWPVYAAAAPDFFDKRQAGGVIGLWTVFLGVGSILSPVLCGWSIDATQSYSYAFAMAAAGALMAALLLLPVLFRGVPAWKHRSSR